MRTWQAQPAPGGWAGSGQAELLLKGPCWNTPWPVSRRLDLQCGDKIKKIHFLLHQKLPWKCWEVDTTPK